MKIQANRDDLLKPLLMVGNVVERRQTLPILANILITGSNNRLSITATDLEVELTTSAAAQLSNDVEFTLPARKLIDICKALPQGADITLDIDGEKVVLKSGRGRYSMGMLAARDYPSIEPSAPSESFTCPESVFKRLIDQTSFAMAQQDVRYYLNGLLFEIKSGQLRTVATDGHRLALCDANFKVSVSKDMQVILPRKAVIELSRLLTDSDDEITVDISNSHVRITMGDTSFTSKLIDGRFPDYERVMPQGDTHPIAADKEILKQALTRTSILSNEKYRGIRFRLTENLLHLQAHNPEQDEAEEEVEIQYTGPEMTIGFNVGYLLDVLSVIGTETVAFAVVDSNSSTLVTPSDTSDSRYVIMPMRL